MKHVLTTLVVVPLLAAAFFAFLGWIFRRRGSSFSVLASVIAQWVVAYVVWALLIGLVEQSGVLGQFRRAPYTTYGFVVFAALIGTWQYRLARSGATQSASRVFLWSQVGWLALVIAERGALG